MPDDDYPEWMDKTGMGVVGIVTLDDGEQVTAEVVDFDEELRELGVEVIFANHSSANCIRERRAIPVDQIVSFEPQPRSAQPWPYSDPCRQGRPFSLPRFALLSTILLCMGPGSIFLFLVLIDRPYGLQGASTITYTLSVVFLTFAATRRFRPFLFTCPAVKPELPYLILRHVGFLAVLFVLQTAALAAHPNLPGWWNEPDRKGSTPFELALLLLCYGLGFAQVYTNRSLLGRAHRDFCGEHSLTNLQPQPATAQTPHSKPSAHAR